MELPSQLAPARSSCLFRLHRLAALAQLLECDARRSTSWVESDRCRWRNSRPSSPLQLSHCQLTLLGRASFNSICMLTALMDYNLVSTGSGRREPSWSRLRVATSALPPLL